MKETGYAGCFCSARQESLPERVRAQIYFELHIFEMAEHMLLGWKTHLFSIFSDTGTTHTVHVLAMLSGDVHQQRGYPGHKEHCQTAAKKAFLADPEEMQ